MRQKKEAVLCFASNDDGLPRVLRDYRARYRTISQVLDDNPGVLDAVHRDIQHLSQGSSKGRKGDFTSENILRALIVQHLEGLPFREAVIRIGGDGFLQDFLRMRKKAVMDFSFLDKCFLAIRPQTWKRVNELLGRYGMAKEAFNPKVIRTDTTVMDQRRMMHNNVEGFRKVLDFAAEWRSRVVWASSAATRRESYSFI